MYVPLGEYLVDNGIITGSQLGRALHMQLHYQQILLGEVMIRLGYLNEAQLDAAVVAQNRTLAFRENATCERLGHYLMEEGLVSERMLGGALVYQHRLRRMRLGDVLVDMGLLTQHTVDLMVARQIREQAMGASSVA